MIYLRVPNIRCLAAGLLILLQLTTGCAVLDFLGLGGPNGTIGVAAFDDAISPNCAEGPAPSKPAVTAPAPETVSHARVYLLRGLINTYSLGLDKLADKLDDLGIQSVLVDWPTYDAAAAQLTSIYNYSGRNLDIFIVGHSYGSDDAVRMAATLGRGGVPVRLLVLLDSSAPDPISDNVDKCIHYFIPTPVGAAVPTIFAGNPVTLAQRNTRTVLQNIPFTEATYGVQVGCANHFSIDVNNYAHILIIEEILNILNP